MPDDYSVQVKAAYDKICKDGSVSPYLKNPTPKNLRKECLAVYRKKNAIGDRDIVCTFLEINPEENVLEPLIKDARLDKFKTVQYFFKAKTEEPRDYTIEFIAWLIDFKLEANDKIQLAIENKEELSSTIPDTAQASEEYVESEAIKENENLEEATNDQAPKGETIIGEGSGNTDMQNGGVTIDDEGGKPPKQPIIIYVILAIILITEGIIAYFAFYHNNTLSRILPAKKECMYWTGDHYEAVSCDSVVVGQQNSIPFHLDEWKYLRKITRPDTLTENDIGKVWYIKIKNDPEIFTFNGRYPLDTNRVLKPLSQHIYETYIPKKKEVALLKNRLIAGGIAFVVTLSVGIWWLVAALIGRKKKAKKALN